MKKLNQFLPQLSYESSETIGEKTKSNSRVPRDFLQLMIHWPIIVGEKMAQNTRPLRLRQDTLTIASLDPLYSSQLMQFQTEIIKRVKEQFPKLGTAISRLNFITTHRPFGPLTTKGNLSNTDPTKGPKKARNTGNQQDSFHPYDPTFIQEKKIWKQILGEEVDPEIIELMASLHLQLTQGV